MKSIYDIFKNEDPTDEAIQRMLATCDVEYEYTNGNMIYCRKCNEPRREWLSLIGGYVPVMCSCMIAEQKKQERLAQIEKYRNTGFPDRGLQKCRFDHDDKKSKKASDMCRSYVRRFSEFKKAGKGLILFGGVGTGKTFLASCIANELIDNGVPCLVTNFARIINTIQGMYEGKQKYLDSLNEFDLLVIDDLGIERNTEYVNELVYNIIDARYRSGKPMIITTNLKYSDLYHTEDTSKARIYSRIIEMCLPVLVSGEDRRKNKMQDSRLMDILNG
jgi:DNA replication protein DnaC